MDRRNVVQSVVRAFKVVEVLNRDRVTSLETLHRTTGLPKPTLIRLLETLIDAGYAFHVSRRDGYAVTENVLRLSAGVRHRDVLVDIARPLLTAFTREHKWQVSLATCETDSMLIRATTRDISPFSREEIFLNRRVGILSSALGRAYIAFCSRKEREFILKVVGASEAPDAAAARHPDVVEAMIARVQRSRYATVQRSRTDPYRSFAVPILASRPAGEVLGSMVMFWYRSVMSERQATQRYLDKMYALAERIASGLSSA